MAAFHVTTFDSTTEEWRDVPEYEGLYQVSSFGRIKSLERLDPISRHLRERIRKLSVSKRGYVTVSLRHPERNGTHKVHVLVMLAFVGVRPVGYDINHKDGNKQNNRLGNLEYCTHRENMLHAFSEGITISKKGSQVSSAKLTEEQVIQIYELHKSGLIARRIAPLFGVNKAHIRRIVRGIDWNHLYQKWQAREK